MESGVTTTTEKVCASLATDIVGSDVEVFTGVDTDDKTAPCVICYAESSTEDFPFSGIFHVRTSIIVKQMAADTTVDSENTLLGNVHNGFLVDNIESILTSKSSSNYYVYQVVLDSNNSTMDGDAWVNSLTLDVVCTTKTS